MPKFLFQLGHCPDLSHAEIIAVDARMGGVLNRLQRAEAALLAESASLEDVTVLVNELAGTIRLCEVVGNQEAGSYTSGKETSPDELFQFLIEVGVESLLTARSDRPLIGFSWVGEDSGKGRRKKRYGLLQETAARLKEHLRGKGISSRFILADPADNSLCLSGAQVEKNHLAEKGAEFVFHESSETGLTLGVTRWLQPFEAFSLRDYGRPQRDARSGMLPPKLARMLINLARTQETRTLIDPFCGSGSVLMEAALTGLEAVGFDNNRKAVEDSKENERWLLSRFPDRNLAYRACLGDARRLHTFCEPLFFDTCVTEPFLGSPRKRPLRQEEWEQESAELAALYIRALGEIRTVVKPGARVVFVAPRFRVQDAEEPASLRLMAEIKLLGYRFLDPLHQFSPGLHRITLLYSRPQQIVQREIFVLQA